MSSIRAFTVSALLAAVRLASASTGVEVAASTPISGTDTVHGCYSNLGNLVFNQTYLYNSQGACAGFCRDMGKTVGASQAKDCYCGEKYPPKNTLVDDSECSEPCPGYDAQACGGVDTWTVYNTGVRVSVADEANITTSSTSISSGADATSSQSVVTVSGSVVVVTPTGSSDSGSKSSNTVGIAVGSVVGVIGAAAIAGALFFMLKRRRNREIEEEHRRNAAVNAFIAGGKAPSSSGGMSISDQRLDPVMVQRRMSSGSIADEQDYSRRILRVTNA